MEINRLTLKRMDNLKGLCDFDTATGTATVHVHYSCLEEILDPAFSSPEKPVIKEEAIEYLQSVVDIVPEEFNVRVSLTIEDYQGYDPQMLIKAYYSELETIDYSEESYDKRKKGMMFAFVFVGIVFLIMAILAQRYNWFGFGGKGLTMIAVILIEALFEVYFEESFIFFTVSRVYQRIINDSNSRFKGIEFD